MSITDRIKYDAPTDAALVWKYPSEEIRLGSQLIVNQSQEALFVRGGTVADCFPPGRHTLATANLPLLGRLFKLPLGGRTPFAAEVWYVNLTAKRDLKWGTKGPIQVLDPVYKYPVSVRAFGRWGLKVSDSRSFVKQLVGSQVGADSAKIEEYFSGEIVQRLSDRLARFFVEQNVSIFQVSARLNELAECTAAAISPEFERFGITIVNFNVERISIPEEEQARFQQIFGKRLEIDHISEARMGQAYATMRSFDTLDKAAASEGAGAVMGAGLALGAGLGAGVPIGQQLGQAINAKPRPEQDDAVVTLQKLKQMLDLGLISPDDYERKKKEVLDKV